MQGPRWAERDDDVLIFSWENMFPYGVLCVGYVQYVEACAVCRDVTELCVLAIACQIWGILILSWMHMPVCIVPCHISHDQRILQVQVLPLQLSMRHVCAHNVYIIFVHLAHAQDDDRGRSSERDRDRERERSRDRDRDRHRRR